MAQVGDTVKLICPIIGTPRPLIEWYQDEQLIQYSSRERFRRGKRYLKIKGVQVVDSGVYVCKGVNGFGSRSVDLNLVVKGIVREKILGKPISFHDRRRKERERGKMAGEMGEI